MESMALPASTLLPSTSKFRVRSFRSIAASGNLCVCVWVPSSSSSSSSFWVVSDPFGIGATFSVQIKHVKDQPCQLKRCLRLHGHHQPPPTCSMKVSMAEFGEPNKVKMQTSVVREKLWEAIPDSVKEIPWKKAEKILLERLLFLGQKALKWTLIILFIFSSFSDIIFSISTNQELMIPFGLFVGCLTTDFLKEISNELFHNSEEKGLNWHLVGIGCFFVIFKLLSANFVIPARVFLLHFANGGLMQLLWLWRKLLESRDKSNGDNYLVNQDASPGKDADDSIK